MRRPMAAGALAAQAALTQLQPVRDLERETQGDRQVKSGRENHWERRARGGGVTIPRGSAGGSITNRLARLRVASGFCCSVLLR